MLHYLPRPDEIALPAAPALIKFLLVLTFIVHILLVDLVLGGGLIAVVTAIRFRRPEVPHPGALVGFIRRALPIIVAFAITFGVAPLLFVQVLYGQFFYAGTILMAWPWLAVVVWLILGYYLWYAYALKEEVSPWVAGLGWLLFAIVGFTYVNMTVMSLTPERWAMLYVRDQAGLNFPVHDPTLVPRFAHFLVAAIAVGGLFVVAHGLWSQKRGDWGYGEWAISYGAAWFVAPTVVQFAVGFLLLLNLPAPIKAQFLGGNAVMTAHLFGAAGLAFIAMILLGAAAAGSERAGPLAISGIALVGVTVVVMAIVRQWVREAYLRPHFDPSQLAVKPQVGAIALFLALLLAGLAVIGWMLLKLRRRTAEPSL